MLEATALGQQAEQPVKSTTAREAAILYSRSFLPADGIPYVQQPYSESARRIDKEFYWNPNQQDLQKCSMATGF
jgi:hypothetical protein